VSKLVSIAIESCVSAAVHSNLSFGPAGNTHPRPVLVVCLLGETSHDVFLFDHGVWMHPALPNAVWFFGLVNHIKPWARRNEQGNSTYKAAWS
jgi:hypothetical protein